MPFATMRLWFTDIANQYCSKDLCDIEIFDCGASGGLRVCDGHWWLQSPPFERVDVLQYYVCTVVNSLLKVARRL